MGLKVPDLYCDWFFCSPLSILKLSRGPSTVSGKGLVINNKRRSYHSRIPEFLKAGNQEQRAFPLCRSHAPCYLWDRGDLESALIVPSRSHCSLLETHSGQVLPCGAFQTLCHLISKMVSCEGNPTHFVVRETEVQFSDFPRS